MHTKKFLVSTKNTLSSKEKRKNKFYQKKSIESINIDFSFTDEDHGTFFLFLDQYRLNGLDQRIRAIARRTLTEEIVHIQRPNERAGEIFLDQPSELIAVTSLIRISDPNVVFEDERRFLDVLVSYDEIVFLEQRANLEISRRTVGERVRLSGRWSDGRRWNGIRRRRIRENPTVTVRCQTEDQFFFRYLLRID